MDLESANNRILEAIEIGARVLRYELIKQNDGSICLLPKNEAGQDLAVSISQIDTISENLCTFNQASGTLISQPRYWESLIDERTQFHRLGRLADTLFSISDHETNCTYSISKPSIELLVMFLSTVGSKDAMQYSPIRFGNMRHRTRSPEDSGQHQLFESEDNDLSIFFTILQNNIRLYSLRITQDNSAKTLQNLTSLAHSYLFTIAYNMNISLFTVDDIRAFYRPLRRTAVRADATELDAPKRLYNRDLTHFYLMALASADPSLEFLSYYHVLEHFFENIYTDDLVASIQDSITHPKFSTKRKSDMLGLVKSISKAISLRDEQFDINEKEALRLTISKYVNTKDFISELNQLYPDAENNLKIQDISFANVAAVDLSKSDDEIIKRLSSRIYSIRNAVVHSKEGEKSRYVPLRHDSQLEREIGYMKLLAEQVITNSAKNIPV